MKRNNMLFRRAICVFMILAMTFPFSLNIFAAETNWENYDWNNHDWSDFSWGDLSEDRTGEKENSLHQWLLTDAPMNVVFDLTDCADGAYATLMQGVLYKRLASDPEGFLCALAAENLERRQLIYWFVSYEGYSFHKDDFIQILETAAISGNDAGSVVLNELIDYVEKEYSEEITNPKTGDTMAMVALLMSFSVAGTAVLLRKQVAYLLQR